MRTTAKSWFLFLVLTLLLPAAHAQAGLLGALFAPFRMAGSMLSGGRRNQGGQQGPGGGGGGMGNHGTPPSNGAPGTGGGFGPGGTGGNGGTGGRPTAKRPIAPKKKTTKGKKTSTKDGDAQADPADVAYPSYSSALKVFTKDATNPTFNALNEDNDFGGYCVVKKTGDEETVYPAVGHTFKNVESETVGLTVDMDTKRESNPDFWRDKLANPDSKVKEAIASDRQEILESKDYGTHGPGDTIDETGVSFKTCKDDVCTYSQVRQSVNSDGNKELVVRNKSEGSVCFFDERVKGTSNSNLAGVALPSDKSGSSEDDGPNGTGGRRKQLLNRTNRDKTDDADGPADEEGPSNRSRGQGRVEQLRSDNRGIQQEPESNQRSPSNEPEPRRAAKHQVTLAVVTNPPACGPCRTLDPHLKNLESQIATAVSAGNLQAGEVQVYTTANGAEFNYAGGIPHAFILVDGQIRTSFTPSGYNADQLTQVINQYRTN